MPDRDLLDYVRDVRKNWEVKPLTLPPNLADVPKGVKYDLVQYAKQGRPLGGFLNRCVENDFVYAALGADDDNQKCLVSIAGFIYERLPSPCWGSVPKVREWLDAHAACRKEEADA